ncbi:MAG: SCO family protein [Verrucomicrobia bacterium]|nr:SCO family protein [Verrucomicrobiota bacterium]
MSFSKLCLGYLVSVILVACGQQSAGTKSGSETLEETIRVFTVNGIVKETEHADNALIVEHEAIPDFMPAMTMPFKVKNPVELEGLQPGNAITFRLSVAENRSWIDQIRKVDALTQNEPPPRPAIRLVRDVEPLKVGDLLPHYRFTNELGRVVGFEDYKGKALAITFIFTRCPIPEFCPLMSKQFTAVQNRLASMPEAPTNWHLFSVSFDPHYDTPAILKGYAKIYGYDPEHWSFVTGSMIDIDAITEQFGLPVVQDGGSLSHKLRTVVVDAQGRIQNIFMGNQWKPTELMDALIEAASASLTQEADRSSNKK